MTKKLDLEGRLKGWYDRVPHLSNDSREWLANNIWWMAIIGVVSLTLSLILIVRELLVALSIASHVFVVMLPQYAHMTGHTWVLLTLQIVQFVFTMLLMAVAVQPLRARARQGWVLLYWSFLVNFGLEIVATLLGSDLGGVLMAIIRATIAGYLLFEIRSYFELHHESRAVKRVRKVVRKIKNSK